MASQAFIEHCARPYVEGVTAYLKKDSTARLWCRHESDYMIYEIISDHYNDGIYDAFIAKTKEMNIDADVVKDFVDKIHTAVAEGISHSAYKDYNEDTIPSLYPLPTKLSVDREEDAEYHKFKDALLSSGIKNKELMEGALQAFKRCPVIPPKPDRLPSVDELSTVMDLAGYVKYIAYETVEKGAGYYLKKEAA